MPDKYLNQLPDTATTLGETDLLYAEVAGVPKKIQKKNMSLTMTGKMTVGNRIEDMSKFAVTYNATTRKWTVTTSSGAVVWMNGLKNDIAAAVVETAAHSTSAGLYWLYYNGSLALTINTTVDFAKGENATIGAAYCNGNGLSFAWDERHEIDMLPDAHFQEHLQGAKYISGGVVADYTLNTGTTAAIRFSCTAVNMTDDGLDHALTALSAGGPYTVFYRAGADTAGRWDWSTTSVNPFLYSGSNIAYNQLTGGNWQQTEITNNNRWVCGYLIGIPSLGGPAQLSMVQGQVSYTSLASAQAESFYSINWGNFRFAAEIVPLKKFIFRRVSSGDTGTYNGQIVEVSTIAGSQIPAAIQTAAVNAPSFGTVAVSGQSDVVADTVNTALNLAEGSGIILETNAGTQTVTIEALKWSTETGDGAMVANHGYISNSGSLVTRTLPTTCAVNKVMAITGLGSGGWKVAQNASQVIHFNASSSTSGTGGYVASASRYDSMTVLCIVADTEFVVIGYSGALSVV